MSSTAAFTLLPDTVATAPLSDRAFRAYAALAHFANPASRVCWPSLRSIAEWMQCGVRKAQHAIAELVAAGLVRVTPRTSAAGDPTSNLYLLNEQPSCPDGRGGGVEMDTRVVSKRAYELDPEELDPEELQQHPAAVAARGSDEEEPAMNDKPADPIPLPLSPLPEPTVKPPNVGDLVAAWCEGWSSTHGGEQPHPSLVKRVAGCCKNASKACASVDDWRDLWRAARKAGGSGRFDVVAELAAPAVRGRGNYHARLIAANDNGLADRIQALLSRQQIGQ